MTSIIANNKPEWELIDNTKINTSYVDLSGNVKIIRRSKQIGFRCLHIFLKLADRKWPVSYLMGGIRSGACSRLDWIEVYGKGVDR